MTRRLSRRCHVVRVPLPAGSSAESRLAALRFKKGAVAVAATGEDERSLLLAALAKHAGASLVAAIVESPSLAAHPALAPALPIDRLINPVAQLADSLLTRLIGPIAFAVQSLGTGMVRMTEFTMRPRWRGAGLSLRDLALPHGARIAAIHRLGRVIPPTAATVLEGGDRILVVANQTVLESAVAQLGAPARDRRLRVLVTGDRASEPRLDALAAALSRVGIRATALPLGRVKTHRAPSDAVVLLDPSPSAERRAFAPFPTAHRFTIGDRARASGPSSTHLLIEAELAHAALALLKGREVERIGAVSPGVLDVYRVEAGDKGPWLGMPLRELPGVHGWTILALQVGRNVYLPHPQEVISPHDVLIVAGPPGGAGTLRKSLRAG